MNFVTSGLLYTGSGSTSRRSATRRLGIFLSRYFSSTLFSSTFGPFRAVLRASLLPIRNADCVERSANHVITDAGKVLHAAASDKNNRVLLQVMTDAGNVGRHLNSVCQAHARDFAQRRIRFLGCLGVNTGADTTL